MCNEESSRLDTNQTLNTTRREHPHIDANKATLKERLFKKKTFPSDKKKKSAFFNAPDDLISPRHCHKQYSVHYYNQQTHKVNLN